MNRLSVLALAAGLAAHPALAEMTGATLELGHSFFTEDSKIAKTTLGGSGEFAFGPTLGVQGDLGINRLREENDTVTDVAVHGLFYVNPQTAMGIFYGMADVPGENIDFYGFEIGQKTGDFDVQAYVGRAETSGLTGSMMGVEGRFLMANGFGVGGRLDHVNMTGLDATRLGVTGSYSLPNGLALSAELGAVNSDDLPLTGTEPYVGIGARFDFGPNRGTSFSRRGLFSAVPGS